MKQLSQHRPMAPGFILTVASHGGIVPVGERRQQRDQPLGRGLPHLGPVATHKGRPPPGTKRLRSRPGDQRGTGRQLRNPHVEVIAPAQLRLFYPPGQPAHGSQPEALTLLARRTETDDADSQGQRGRIEPHPEPATRLAPRPADPCPGTESESNPACGC